jgi:hypothetical protein
MLRLSVLAPGRLATCVVGRVSRRHAYLRGTSTLAPPPTHAALHPSLDAAPPGVLRMPLSLDATTGSRAGLTRS